MTLTPATLREDLKCGKGAISKGEKCHKGAATEAQAAKALVTKGKVARGWQLREANWGEKFGAYGRSSFANNVGASAKVGAITGAVTGGITMGLPGAALGGAVGGIGGAALGAAATPIGAAWKASTRRAVVLERKNKTVSKKRKDSVFADGFAMDYDQLAV